MNNLLVYEKVVAKKGRAVFSVQSIEKGKIVVVGKPIKRVSERTWLSLQIDKENHIRLDMPFEIVNHSCQPNCGIQHNEFGGYTLIALEDIEKDIEITFDYAMTEWECIHEFNCLCGGVQCRKDKIGAKMIDKTILQRYKPYLSDYIMCKVKLKNKHITKEGHYRCLNSLSLCSPLL